QPGYAALAAANAEANGRALQVHAGDLAAMPAALRRAFDHVIANPPYHPPGRGTAARDAGRALALAEAAPPLAAGSDAARRRLRPGGGGPRLHAAARHLHDGDDLTEAARAVLREGAALNFDPPLTEAC
ncbi:MAG: methyltransferase, partial [Gemmobacter sp.]